MPPLRRTRLAVRLALRLAPGIVLALGFLAPNAPLVAADAPEPPALAPSEAAAADAPEAQLSEHLAPFAPLVGKTWKGRVEAPGAAEGAAPVHDVSRWEAALGGQAVRILHALSDASYGGETVIVWDARKESLVFFYFTTGGFYTTGTLAFDDDGRFTSREEITGGSPHGITEVEAVGEILPDGRLKSSARYLKDGEWTDGQTTIYEEAPDAVLVLDQVRGGAPPPPVGD